MTNALSVDVEDYFQVRSFEHKISFSSWDSYETRFASNTRKLIELFGNHGVKATFFFLGWNADRDRGLVREVAAAGHEIASHGWSHELVYRLSRSEFKKEVLKTKSLLEDISGTRVAGFRAPSYSITERSMWALDVLAETGHLYDSSIYPIKRRVYGIASAERCPHLRKVQDGEIAEFPMSTVRLANWNIPFASGAYLRLLPCWATRRFLTQNNRRNLPVMVSVHPWEVDPDQPRLCRVTQRPNHYWRLGQTRSILESLLGSFQFASVREVLQELGLLAR